MTIKCMEVNEFPPFMKLVPNYEELCLIKMDDLVLVPLVQVIDKLLEPAPDAIVRNGKKICPVCRREITNEEDK